MRTIRAGAALMLTAMVFSSPPAVGAAAAAAPQQRGAGNVPAGDELITGTGDADGYHLFAAAAGDGWAWHPLATFLPGGGGEQKWIGQQCLTTGLFQPVLRCRGRRYPDHLSGP